MVEAETIRLALQLFATLAYAVLGAIVLIVDPRPRAHWWFAALMIATGLPRALLALQIWANDTGTHDLAYAAAATASVCNTVAAFATYGFLCTYPRHRFWASKPLGLRIFTVLALVVSTLVAFAPDLYAEMTTYSGELVGRGPDVRSVGQLPTL